MSAAGPEEARRPAPGIDEAPYTRDRPASAARQGETTAPIPVPPATGTGRPGPRRARTPGHPLLPVRPRYAVAAAASAARAFKARSTPERDSEIRRRRAAFGLAEASQASVASRVSWATWTAG